MPIRRRINRRDLPVDTRLDPNAGWVRMLVTWLATADTMGTRHLVLGHTVFPPVREGPSRHALHRHPNAEEIEYIVWGRGRAVSGDEEFLVGEGDIIFVPQGERHSLENVDPEQPLEVLWIYGGAASLAEAGYELVE
jgi:mannose-6-phosphate isomerase-like protein (cupin superfamily)